MSADPNTTNALISQFIAVLPATIIAFGTLVVAIGGFYQIVQAKKAIASQSKKTDALTAKTEQIHEVTNGNLSRVTTELKVAQEQIEGLKKLVWAVAQRDAMSREPAPADPTTVSTVPPAAVEIPAGTAAEGTYTVRVSPNPESHHEPDEETRG